MGQLILDFGNARGKWFVAKTGEFGDFEHAIAQLSENDWKSVVGRGKPPEGIIKVEGIPYAVGKAARRYVLRERPVGAARYRASYYGVALAYALSEAFRRSDPKISLFASHAPGDVDYVPNLIQAAKSPVEVECTYGTLSFDVTRVSTFDEPLGGYSHYVFNKTGEERRKNPMAEKTVLVLDVGGYTSDVVAVDPGGEIDLLSLKSTRTGVLKLLETFENELRSNNKTMFQDTGDLDNRRVETAIRTGVYRFGKIEIPCLNEARESIQSLVNDVVQVIASAGGVANFDTCLLTGGGSALIYDALVVSIPRMEFVLSEPNREYMKYANVFGGAKIAALIRNMNASR